MDDQIEKMYDDAMIVENLKEVVSEAALCNVKILLLAWNQAKDRLGSFISRLATIDMDRSRQLLKCWQESAEGQTDFRQLSYNIEKKLLPAVSESLNKMYKSVEIIDGKWCFQSTDVLFFTAKKIDSDRYIHSRFDPMKEALILANTLYIKGMLSFHILGSGLGYLPYQIWEVSKHSIKIYVYEDDKVLLDRAYNIGFLGLIDENDLCIISEADTDYMLRQFIEVRADQTKGKYISDYKTGAYKWSIYGENIDNIDFNMRTERSFAMQWEANRIRNSRLNLKSVSLLKKDYPVENKDFVVVSAGPSLNDNIDFLKNCSDKLVIICVNAAIKRLISEKIRPSIIVMIDPLPVLETHIRGIEEYTLNIPLVMPIIGSSAFSERYKGPIYILPEDDETDGFEWNYGGTVASLGLDMAVYLGAERVFLIGSDLAYAGGKNYADGLPHDKDEGTFGIQADLYVESVDGGMVKTNPLYNVYRDIIEKQIAIHSDIEVINLSKNGALIRGTVII